MNIDKNFMKTFKIKSTSWVHFILTLLIVFVGGSKLATTIFPAKNSPEITGLILVVFSVLSIFLTKFTSLAIIEVTLTDKAIHVKWLKNYWFQSHTEWTIYWHAITEYKYQEDRNMDLLKIKVSNGQLFRIWHNNGFTKDDFHELVIAFEEGVKHYNQANSHTPAIIKRSKTIYETKAGLILAILLGTLLLAIPVFSYLLPLNVKTNWPAVTSAYAGGIFFIGQVMYYRRKRTSQA